MNRDSQVAGVIYFKDACGIALRNRRSSGSEIVLETICALCCSQELQGCLYGF